MPNIFSKVANVVFFLSIGLFLSTAHSTHAEFYVIAGAGGKPIGTEITSLPYTISSPGFYYISKNIAQTAISHGILIEANNVTLDLMGYSIIGPPDSGLYSGIRLAASNENIAIRNGTVEGYPGTGIYGGSTGIKSCKIENINASYNGGSGIDISGWGTIIDKCTAIGNSINGIRNLSGAVITNSSVRGNGYRGISAGSAVISHNSSADNDEGLYVGSGSTVIGNSIHSNTNLGVNISSFGNVFFDQNSITNNGQNINSCSSCTFGSNHIP